MQRRKFISSTIAGVGAAAGMSSANAAPPVAGSARPTNPDGTTASLDPRDLLRVTSAG